LMLQGDMASTRIPPSPSPGLAPRNADSPSIEYNGGTFPLCPGIVPWEFAVFIGIVG
jgi:hypothetical protein